MLPHTQRLIRKPLCETTVQPDGTTWVVRLRETWDPARFRLAGEQAAGDFAHTWAFTVDANGEVVRWEHEGNFPPQFGHTEFNPISLRS